MIPSNIDLTANNDFMISILETIYSNKKMLSTRIPWISYTKMNSRFENIFRRIHEQSYIREEQTHCYRCGKEIKIPWKQFRENGLCEDCKRVMYRKSIIQGRIPVFTKNRGEIRPNRIRSIFDLR